MTVATVAQRSGFGTRQGLAKAMREEYDLAISDVRAVRRGHLLHQNDEDPWLKSYRS